MPNIPDVLTPPEVGRRLRIKPERVIAFIRAGELRAFDVASPGSTRPRFRVRLEDVERFADNRQVKPPAKPTRRRRKRTAETRKFY